MTVPPLAYPDIKMTDKYANPEDERGKKSGEPKSLVGIGERGIFFFHRYRIFAFSVSSLETAHT